VIGRRARRVPASEALQYVRGYTAANDFGVHDFRHADRGSMLRAKGIDGLLPLGPVIADATGMDPSSLTLRTYVNGELRQQANTAELLFPCEYLIADLTRLITLERDDVILTGTPANSRPVQPGDEVEVEIEGIGRISNTVVPDDAPLAQVGAQPQQTDDARRLALGAPI
jgi:2-keto-4-pentenoate hydratase/2-oxohepta-3-ene-1,7-dioic acid hydratase in catechol pathway